MVECDGLENRWTCKRPQGSNPCLPAIYSFTDLIVRCCLDLLHKLVSPLARGVYGISSARGPATVLSEINNARCLVTQDPLHFDDLKTATTKNSHPTTLVLGDQK